MSCFQVSDVHIAAIAAKSINLDVLKFAAMLARANVKSVNYRYNEQRHAVKVTNESFKKSYNLNLNDYEVVKLIDCFIYQSCEIDTFYKSSVKKELDSIKNRLTYRIVSNSQHYNNAEWSI